MNPLHPSLQEAIRLVQAKAEADSRPHSQENAKYVIHILSVLNDYPRDEGVDFDELARGVDYLPIVAGFIRTFGNG